MKGRLERNSEIMDVFIKEFSSISEKFVVLEENLSDLENSTKKYIYHPGVYIFLNKSGVIKVGRHLTNSRKRALEHIRDKTGNDDFNMAEMKNDTHSRVILINVKHLDDNHWLAALEIFLEKELKPKIKSKRH